MENVVLKISNLDCPSCSKKIEKALIKKYGDKVSPVFDLTTKELNIDYDPSIDVKDIIATIKSIGYNACELDD